MHEANQSADPLTWERRLPLEAVDIATKIAANHAITQTVTSTLACAIDDLTAGALEEHLRGTRPDALDVDRDDEQVTYTVTLSGDTSADHATAAAASGLGGLAVTIFKTPEDGFLRSAFRVSLFDPFEDGWGTSSVTQTLSVPWAMNAQLDSESGREITFSVSPAQAHVAGWKTAGLITLGILTVLLLAAATTVIALRTQIARLWGAAADRTRATHAQRTAASPAAPTPAATTPSVATGAEVPRWAEADLR